MPLVIAYDRIIVCRTILTPEDLGEIVDGEVEHRYMLANIAYAGEKPIWQPEINVYINMHAEELGLPINMLASRRLKMEDNPVHGIVVLSR